MYKNLVVTNRCLEFKKFNKTIIPFALVGYEIVIANEARSAELAIYHQGE